jgi:hypothetical protein
MKAKAAITVHRPPDEVRELWERSGHRPPSADGATVTFTPSPGDRGTEIHVALERSAPGGRVGEAVQKLATAGPLARLKDELRRFKQVAETGEVTRSEGSPEGERVERKLKQRPAQPLDASELEKAGA